MLWEYAVFEYLSTNSTVMLLLTLVAMLSSCSFITDMEYRQTVLHCANNPCLNQGECHEDPARNSYTCDCTPAFIGINCEFGKYTLYKTAMSVQ